MYTCRRMIIGTEKLHSSGSGQLLELETVTIATYSNQ